MTKTKLLHFFTLLMLIIFSINIGNFYLITKDKAPSFDEINMKIASQKPFANIWLGRDTISFVEFVKIGIKKIKKEKIKKTSINKENDGFYLRNHHGILNLQLAKIVNSDQIYGINKQNLLIIILLVLSFTIASCRKKFSFFYHTNLIIFFISTPLFLHSLTGPTHHLLLGFALTIMSISLIDYELTKKKRYIYLLIIGFAISILAIETSIFFIFFFTLFFFINFKENLNFKNIIKFVAFLLLIILVLYPGFYYGLDVFKSIFMLIYRIVFDSSLSFGDSGSTQLLNQIFRENLIFIAFALVVNIFFLKEIKKYKTIYFLFFSGIAYNMFFLGNLFDQSYLFPGLVLIMLSLITLIKEFPMKLNNILIILVVPIFIMTQINFYLSNQKIESNYNVFLEKITGHTNADNFKNDIYVINKYVEKKILDSDKKTNNKKIKIYSDFPRLFHLNNLKFIKIIKESYIDNNEIIIRNNFDQFNLFGSNIIKEKINLIFIFQKRLVTDNVYTSLYNEGFIKEKLNINNFIIFQK
jgi:hypothetical protein